VIRSMYTDIPAHEVATVFMNTGSTRLARPSIGSWVLYGLGTENQNMPGYVSLRPGGTPPGGSSNWQSSFLPGLYQASALIPRSRRSTSSSKTSTTNTPALPEQRRQLDLVHKLNELHSQNLQKDAQLEARLQAYEMAFKMQTEATTPSTSTKKPRLSAMPTAAPPRAISSSSPAASLERGVRFVQVWAGGWTIIRTSKTGCPSAPRTLTNRSPRSSPI